MSGHTPSEPVAWRWRMAGEVEWRGLTADPRWPVWARETGIKGEIEPLYSHAPNEAKIEALETALEWALAHCQDSEHPHYPYFSDEAWRFPYLANNDGGSGGGVGEASFDTALEAVQDAIRRTALQAATGGRDDG